MIRIFSVKVYFTLLNFKCLFRKMAKTLKQFLGKLPSNCLSVFDHFVKLALKGLNYVFLKQEHYQFSLLVCYTIILLQFVARFLKVQESIYYSGLTKYLAAYIFWLFLTWLTLWCILPQCNYSKLKLFKISDKNLIMDS